MSANVNSSKHPIITIIYSKKQERQNLTMHLK